MTKSRSHEAVKVESFRAIHVSSDIYAHDPSVTGRRRYTIIPMLDYTISTEQLAELCAAHRRTRDQHETNRIKAVVWL